MQKLDAKTVKPLQAASAIPFYAAGQDSAIELRLEVTDQPALSRGAGYRNAVKCERAESSPTLKALAEPKPLNSSKQKAQTQKC